MSTLTGTGALVRHVLRLDRVRLAIWTIAFLGLMLSSAASLPPLYPTQADIDQYASLFGDNPALVAFAGPGYGFDNPNIGVILVNETQLFGMIILGLMAMFLVNRHTRAEEDAERTDLIRSGRVGRDAPIAAPVVVVSGAIVAICAACAVGFVALEYPVNGSIALAGSLAAVGLVFVGVTVVTAQIASSSRASLAMAGVLLGASFVLRAAGDIAENWLRWTSPIGWAQGVRAYAGDRWWALLLCLVVGVALVAVGFWLSAHRDLGSGLVATRQGPADAQGMLTLPGGLALRLQRATLIGWMAGQVLIAVVYGSIGDEIETMIRENPSYADFMAQLQGVSITDAYFSTTIQVLGILAAGFAISSALRLRSEEAAGRVESILATPTSRSRWAASHLGIAVLGTVLVVGSGGLGLGVTYAVVSGDSSQVLRLLAASLVAVPAVLVLVGVATLIFGVAPRATPIAWAGLALVFLVSFFGEVLRLPEWVRAMSPFDHLPGVPGEGVALAPLLLLSLLAAALIAGGLVAFGRRDLATQ